MKLARCCHAGLLGLAAAAHVSAATPRLSIPAEPLGEAIVALGAALGLSVGLGEGVSPGLPANPIQGRKSGHAALHALTRGLPVVVVRIDDKTFRIDRPAEAGRARPRIAATPPERRADIVVTASKRDTRLDLLPATVLRFAAAERGAAAGPQGSDALVDALPSVGSTELGPGRNKLFLRGVADSSFNGLSQSTVSQYFGEARLTYNAPDPNLLLVDTASVEVLEGPQGTLYGATALGGVIRVIPNHVRLDRIEGALSLGFSATAHGADGSDGSATFNLPLLDGRLGARLVAYRSVDGGYIDDTERARVDVNRTVTKGGRLTLLGDLGGGWSVEAGGITQDIDAADGQYAERGLPPLTRRTAVAQPFDNDYRLGDLIVRGSWGAASLVSVTSGVRHHVNSTYDFTVPGEPLRVFQEQNAITLLAHETRLAQTRADGSGWIVGVSLLHEGERLIRTLGSPPDPPRITGVRNAVDEAAIYGEWTVGLGHGILITTGARASFDRLAGEQLDEADREEGSGSHRREHRVVPSVALAWHPHDTVLLFGRYASGYRPGGLSVAGESDLGSGTSTPERFRGDRIGTYEIGTRLGSASDRVSGTVTLSQAHWRHIQADLVSTAGFPYTANVGDGRIRALEASLVLRPTSSLDLQAALTVQHGTLTQTDIPTANAEDRDLPNVPGLSGRLAVDWHHPVGRLQLQVEASARYVGRSHLGVGDVLDVPQGDYIDSRLGLRLGTERLAGTIGLTNLADTHGNRFAFGNPFTVADRRQVTPLRPRTLRIGFDAHF